MANTRAKAKAESKTLSPLVIDLDPENPRLTADEQGKPQEELLEILLVRFKLVELGTSIVASGYNAFDPLVGLRQKSKVIVLEGNRRIGALKLLLNPELAPKSHRATWTELARQLDPADRKEIEKVDILTYGSRDEANVSAYIGFRHVTSVLKWAALEKAAYIARLIEKQKWTYPQIAKRLGSYPRHVERHYVAYRVVMQAEDDEVEGYKYLRDSFGVLLRALQAGGVSEFLGVEYPGNPKESKDPVPTEKSEEFENFVAWTFGTDESPPILKDSRQLTRWAKILQSPPAYRYLKATSNPRFERAWRKCGGELESLSESLFAAADRLEESVATIEDHVEEDEVREGVGQCTRFMAKILEHFPDIAKEHGLAKGK
jgi:hypothetical protein